jgi:hypothetical protein
MLRTVILVGLTAVLAVVIMQALPDIKRYVEISKM